ncbi:OmpA family protein [bacterium]|nr:OmpA family protein [bacterium]
MEGARTMRRIVAFVLIGALAVGLLGCASMSRSDMGLLIGAGTGAVVGGAIGDASGNTAIGAILGAVIGGAAGAAIGNYMDDQAAEIEADIEGATVERIGEGIKITFDSGLLFDVDKSDLRPTSQENVTELARILNKYDDTDILIEGHTDSDGSDEYNMTLSERRARSVAVSLVQNGVNASRTTVTWYGEAQPVATNDTVDGKQANRRVEVAIMANDDLKAAAERGALSE